MGCVAMLLNGNKNVSELVKRYKDTHYLSEVGWKHNGLVSILSDFGIKSDYSTFTTLLDLIRSLKNKKPAILSISVPFPEDTSQTSLYISKSGSPASTGHLILLVGVNNEGFIVHEPRNNGVYSKNLLVPFGVIVRVFSGRAIFVIS